MTVEVRRAVPADAVAMRAVAVDAYGMYGSRMSRPPAPVEADYDSLVATAECWVADSDGEVVALLVLVPHDDHLFLDNIAVHSDAQGLGVGSMLLAHVDARARALGVAEIRLYTNEVMVENQALYVRRGYVETHRETDDGYARVYYTKQLGTG